MRRPASQPRVIHEGDTHKLGAALPDLPSPPRVSGTLRGRGRGAGVARGGGGGGGRKGRGSGEVAGRCRGGRGAWGEGDLLPRTLSDNFTFSSEGETKAEGQGHVWAPRRPDPRARGTVGSAGRVSLAVSPPDCEVAPPEIWPVRRQRVHAVEEASPHRSSLHPAASGSRPGGGGRLPYPRSSEEGQRVGALQGRLGWGRVGSRPRPVTSVPPLKCSSACRRGRATSGASGRSDDVCRD